MLACNNASRGPADREDARAAGFAIANSGTGDDPAAAHLTCFNATTLERTLAVRLGLPLYGCDPTLAHLVRRAAAEKSFAEPASGCRRGTSTSAARHDLRRALVALKREHPTLRKAVIKLEEGFSGEGNATFSYDGAPAGAELESWVRRELPVRARCVAAGETWDGYSDEFARLGGIVEAYVDGVEKRSPSVQCRISPIGETQIISTHDQVLGGSTGQIYLGCTFPAEASCCPGLHDAAQRVTAVLAEDGVVARFGIDFVSTRCITPRISGSIMRSRSTFGRAGRPTRISRCRCSPTAYTTQQPGCIGLRRGRPCFYVASDNLCDPAFASLHADVVISAAERCGLAFDRATETGAVFHLLGALSEFGKLGAVCIAPTRERAHELFARSWPCCTGRPARRRTGRVCAVDLMSAAGGRISPAASSWPAPP